MKIKLQRKRDSRKERMMNVDEAIAIVKSKAAGRTRWEGQEPFLDELLVAEIERLRAIEHQLPITADGVRVVPWGETRVYRHIMYHGAPRVQESMGWAHNAAVFAGVACGEPSQGTMGRNVELCYSTREAAGTAERSA